MIFIDVKDTEIKVSGETYPINSVLGARGLQFKFNKDTKAWRGPLSLKALETLQDQSGAVLTSSAQDEIARFQMAAKKRAAYLKSRAGAI